MSTILPSTAIEQVHSDAIAVLRLMLADGSLPAPYRRAVVELLRLFDQASGLPADAVIEPAAPKSVVVPLPTQEAFTTRRYEGRKPSADVRERIERVLLALNSGGPASAQELANRLQLSHMQIYHAISTGKQAFIKISYGRFAATRVSELWIHEPGKTPLVHSGSKIA